MLFQRIIYGLLLVAIGIVTLKFNYQIVGFTGRQNWIEDKLGSGTTYFVFKLISLILIIAGIIYITGYADSLLTYLLSPLGRLFNPR